MAESVPVVYLLHGEDDFAVAKFVKELQGRLGDPSKAEMNTTRLDGGSFDLEELRAAAGTMPFLARRRLVILEDPGRKINKQSMRKKFLGVLQGLPETTALILYKKKSLDKTHWLLKWQRRQEAGLISVVLLCPGVHKWQNGSGVTLGNEGERLPARQLIS